VVMCRGKWFIKCVGWIGVCTGGALGKGKGCARDSAGVAQVKAASGCSHHCSQRCSHCCSYSCCALVLRLAAASAAEPESCAACQGCDSLPVCFHCGAPAPPLEATLPLNLSQHPSLTCYLRTREEGARGGGGAGNRALIGGGRHAFQEGRPLRPGRGPKKAPPLCVGGAATEGAPLQISPRALRPQCAS